MGRLTEGAQPDATATNGCEVAEPGGMMALADLVHTQAGERHRSPFRAPAARSRIAILSTWHPAPVDNGRKQRTQWMISALAEEYDVLLISLLPPSELRGNTLSMVPDIWRQWALPLPEFAPRSLPALLAGFHTLPRSIIATWSRQTAHDLQRILRAASAELAIGTDMRTMRYLLDLAPTYPTLLDEPDVSPFLTSPGRLGPSLRRWQALARERKYRRFLSSAGRIIGGAIAASEQEAMAYRQLSGSSQVTIIENGIGALPEPAWRAPATNQLIYAGSLTYAPNAEAVAYFAREVLPRLEQDGLPVSLHVTGQPPATQPPETVQPAVTLTGWLTSAELEQTYRQSRACVVPLLSGTGTRIKLLEALALGMPIVTTSKGAEGLAVVSGEQMLIADTPEDFAAAVARLLRDAAYAEALGARGRVWVQANHDWSALGEKLRELVRASLAVPHGIG